MRLGIPTSKSLFLWRLSSFDLFWAILAPFLALGLRDPTLLEFDANAGVIPHSYQYAALTVAFAIPAFLFFRINEGMSRFFAIDDFRAVVAATLVIVAGTSATLFIINRLEGVPRSTPLIYGLVLASGLLGGRTVAMLSRMEPEFFRDDSAQSRMRRVILVGVDRFASLVVKLTDCQQPRTTQVVAALDARERLRGRTINGVKIVGGPADLEAVIEEYRVHGVDVDEVWLADNATTRSEMALIEQQCRSLGVRASAISQALNLTQRHEPNFREASVEPSMVAPHVSYFRVKRLLDLAAAAILSIVLAPIAFVIAGLTYFDVGAPVIFWQRRIGRGGREFLLFKFRTYQALYNKKGEMETNEARLSWIGKAVRATRLDEIPQLYNILRGDMSLIGPRPLLPVDQPDDPSSRLLVRPGVTGWAQVNGGTLVSTDEKDALDIWYIHHASPILDIKIIVRTLRIVFRGENKQHDAIATAVTWREKARQIDQRLFGDDALTTAEVDI